MVTVDQFLKALAVTESADDPEAWGDAGRAMGRWQIHPDRFWHECQLGKIFPKLGETWDQVVARILRAIAGFYLEKVTPAEIAMYWHLGHWVLPTDSTWDQKYASRFELELVVAQGEMP